MLFFLLLKTEFKYIFLFINSDKIFFLGFGLPFISHIFQYIFTLVFALTIIKESNKFVYMKTLLIQNISKHFLKILESFPDN